MAHEFVSRQTTALDLCPYVAWEDYNWSDIIQCNPYNPGLKIPWNPAVYCIIASAHAVALYMTIILIIKTVRRFDKWNALYPWSLLFAAVGLIGLVITCDLSIWVLRPGNKAWTALNIISSISWLSGFALVLYSRLHLIIPPSHYRVRQGILILILIDMVAFHTPGITATIIGTYGSQELAYEISKHAVYIDIGFAGQDILLSSVYIYYYWRYMRDSSRELPLDIRKKLRNMLMLLLGAYFVVIISIVLSLVLLGEMLLLARYTMLPLVNVFNLQVEFFVLNRLVKTAKLKNEALQRGNISDAFSAEAECDTIRAIEDMDVRALKSDPNYIEPDIKGKGSIASYGNEPCTLRNDIGHFKDTGPSDLDDLERQYLGNSMPSKT